MEQNLLDCMILLQLTEIEICMGESICRDSCYNHLHNDLVISCVSAYIFICDNSKENDLIYDKRHTYVEIVPFDSG